MKGRPVPKKLDVTVTAPSSGYVVIAGGSRRYRDIGTGFGSWAEMFAEVEGKEGDYWKNRLPKGGKE